MAKRLLSFTRSVQGVNVSAVTDPLVWEHVQPAAARRLLTGAVDAFAERGYQATTTRDIASRAGMSPAALYVHYPSKERLLFEISLYGHNAALDVLRSADTGSAPADRLRSLVAAFTAWHAEHHTIARVVHVRHVSHRELGLIVLACGIFAAQSFVYIAALAVVAVVVVIGLGV